MNPINLFSSFGRHLLKKKGYFIANLLTIVLGLTAAGFAIIFLHHELSYDTMHPDADRIFRVSYQNKSGWFASLARPHADALRLGTISEIEALVRVRRWPAKMVRVGDKRLHSPKILFTDPESEFFDFFNFPFVQGDASSALCTSNSAVISQSLALSYFGNDPAIGETIRLDTMELTITGVMQDLPSRTHLVFDMLITNAQAMDAASAHFTYARLVPATSPEKIASRVLALPAESNSFNTPMAIRLINIRDLHYEGNMTYELKPAGNRSYLWIIGTIGLIIVVISAANYVNLSVGLYAYRSKEIAVRKSIGASAASLSTQFFLESCATILVAMIMSGLMIHWLTPYFNGLMDLHIEAPLTSPWLIGPLTMIGLIIAAGAAIYPIAVLPGIRILDLFKRAGITTPHGLRLRTALLSVQFVILFFVCCSMWFIHKQVTFMMTKDLGFIKEGVLKVKGAWNVDSTHYWRLKEELMKNPAILYVSEGYAPGDEDYGYTFRLPHDPSIRENLLVHNSDFDYLPTLGIKVIEGPGVSAGAGVPRRLYFVNKTMAKLLDIPNVIGEKITLNPGQQHERTITIDGVVEDYNFQSLHSPVGPQVLSLSERSKYVDGTILVKVATENMMPAVKFIERTLARVVPDEPVTVAFLNDDLERLYHQESHLNKAVVVLAAISIILSFAGLLALCSYMVEFRLKEVALRKTFGADAVQIMLLFISIFAKVSIFSFVIGSCASFFFMDTWMEGFAYRVGISLLPFILAFVVVSCIAFSVVGLQSLRAVHLDPASVLKNE